MVIQRFGSVAKLVEQTLDPMVSSYFKNASQARTLLELIQSRSELQDSASKDMRDRFGAYSLQFQEVLIGTPRAAKGDDRIEAMFSQLRDRGIAKEQVATFAERQIAADKQRELNEAEQRAAKQSELTASLVNVSIQDNNGAAAVKAAERRRQEIEALASADKFRQENEGQGRAAAIRAVGEAEASAIQAKSDAMEGAGAERQLMQAVMMRFAEAFEKAGTQLVPQIQVGGMGGEGGGGAFGQLMGIITSLKTLELGNVTGAAPSGNMGFINPQMLSNMRPTLGESHQHTAGTQIGGETKAISHPQAQVAPITRPAPAPALELETVSMPKPRHSGADAVILNAADKEADPAQRAAYYNQVDQQLATNDVTVIPLFQKPTQLGYRNSIKGMVDNPTQDGFTWNIEDWTYSG